MSRVKLAFERHELPDLPTARRPLAPSRRDAPLFVDDVQQVVVTGIRIPFFRLVWLIIQLALAAILALLAIGASILGGIVLCQLAWSELARWQLSNILASFVTHS